MQHNYTSGNYSRHKDQERPGGYTNKPAANYYQKYRSGHRGRNNDHYGYSSSQKDKESYRQGSGEYYSKSRKNDDDKDYHRRSKDKTFSKPDREASPFASKAQNKTQISNHTNFEVQLSTSVEEKAAAKVSAPVQT